jgi:hypothetical protein
MAYRGNRPGSGSGAWAHLVKNLNADGCSLQEVTDAGRGLCRVRENPRWGQALPDNSCLNPLSIDRHRSVHNNNVTGRLPPKSVAVTDLSQCFKNLLVNVRLILADAVFAATNLTTVRIGSCEPSP